MIETASEREKREKAEMSARLARAKEYATKHNEISPIEAELAQCEAIIERGMSTFREVGNALLKIRDELLYKEDFSNFESYLKERWKFSRAYAYRIIESATVVENLKVSTIVDSHGSDSSKVVENPKLSPIGDSEPLIQLPKSEWVARELAKVPKEKQLAVWKEALELHKGNPSADQVRRVAFPTVIPTGMAVSVPRVASALASFKVAWLQVGMGPIWKRASKLQRKKIIEWMSAQ